MYLEVFRAFKFLSDKSQQANGKTGSYIGVWTESGQQQRKCLHHYDFSVIKIMSAIKLFSILSRIILYKKLGLILEYFLYYEFITFSVDKKLIYEGIFGFYCINLFYSIFIIHLVVARKFNDNWSN